MGYVVLYHILPLMAFSRFFGVRRINCYRNVFSGEKLPQGIFCAKTGGLNVEGIVPPSYLLEGTLIREAGLMMDFYGGIWKKAHLARENCNHSA